MTIITILMALALFSYGNDSRQQDAFPDSRIVIVYDNDVHCAVDGYAKLAAVRNQQKEKTDYVTTVSCGDFVNGGVIGAFSKGESIVDIMNEVGYDIVTLGNHEFNYGMEQMFKLTDALESEVICSNMKNCQTDEYVFPAYHIVKYGDIDVGYIGFTTTTCGTVGSLSDDNGNLLYTFMRDEFYQNAQNFIDEVRAEGADYVIALSHLGDKDRGNGHPSSLHLIENTVGIDAVIDGHEHSVIEERFVNNKEGKSVLLTSSGTAFNYVGMLAINTNGTLESKLIDIMAGGVAEDASVKQYVEEIKEDVYELGEKVIGHSDVYLTFFDEEGNYIACRRDVNLGNFCVDAYRSYTSADVAVINAGGIRAEINMGDVTYNEVLGMHPFGNDIATATVTGQQLMDILEFSVSALPEMASSFLQVSGMRFDINASIPSPVVWDIENDIFSHVGEGKRRVSHLRVLDTETGEYNPVDLNCTYTIASIDYLIFDLGSSGILRYVEPEDTYWTTDLEAIIHYIDELGGVIGQEYGDPEGRIVVVEE